MSECKVEARKRKGIVIKSKDRHARYVYRHYLGVDIKVGEEACNDGVDNDLDGELTDAIQIVHPPSCRSRNLPRYAL